MEATGTISVGESTDAQAYIRGRRGISPRWMMGIGLLGMIAAGLPAGFWATGSWTLAGLTVEATIFGLAVALVGLRLLGRPSISKALAARGQRFDLPLTLRQTPEELVYDLGEVVLSARWSCVTDLYQTRKYWVFLVQSSAMVLPRRFFATPEAEKAFIAEALSRMPDAARGRSPQAVKLADARQS
jgi:hypothetical protein